MNTLMIVMIAVAVIGAVSLGFGIYFLVKDRSAATNGSAVTYSWYTWALLIAGIVMLVVAGFYLLYKLV